MFTARKRNESQTHMSNELSMKGNDLQQKHDSHHPRFQTLHLHLETPTQTIQFGASYCGTHGVPPAWSGRHWSSVCLCVSSEKPTPTRVGLQIRAILSKDPGWTVQPTIRDLQPHPNGLGMKKRPYGVRVANMQTRSLSPKSVVRVHAFHQNTAQTWTWIPRKDLEETTQVHLVRTI